MLHVLIGNAAGHILFFVEDYHWSPMSSSARVPATAQGQSFLECHFVQPFKGAGCVQTPKKKIRLGLPATQWITVYNAHRPMKQRYHYNVANTRVDQHVEKGNDDGLYISSVACCQELWALIMDAGTGFTAQVRTSLVLMLPSYELFSGPAMAQANSSGLHGSKQKNYRVLLVD